MNSIYPALVVSLNGIYENRFGLTSDGEMALQSLPVLAMRTRVPINISAIPIVSE